jgi:hypothetical protein
MEKQVSLSLYDHDISLLPGLHNHCPYTAEISLVAHVLCHFQTAHNISQRDFSLEFTVKT